MLSPVQNRLSWIDALRVIAILAVVGFHLIYEFYPTSLIRPIGFFGVSLFFMISGFVLAKHYSNVPLFDLGWYKKRWFKIASLYYPTLVVLVILLSTQSFAAIIYDLAMHFVFLDYLSPSTIYSIISPAWFVVPLVGLYLLFPFLNSLLKKRPWLFSFAVLITFFFRYFNPEGPNFTSFSPIFFLAEFCFGIVCAYGFWEGSFILPAINAIIFPVMALTYPVFYIFSKWEVPGSIRIPVAFIGAHTFEIFLFHESIMKVTLGQWHIWGLDTNGSLAVLLFSLFLVMKFSERLQKP